MYVLAAALSSLPFFHMGELNVGLPIQAFGVIVAAGVLIGASILRRYAEWHGVEDDHIRGLLAWVTICGFLGAHEFDMIAYNWEKIGDSTVVTPASWWPGFLPDWLYPSNWPLPLKIWEGISSYGGFIGGALGFAFYVWWKRLPVRLFADITIVGLLPAFSIGRIGCTVVSDHIGAALDPSKWYAVFAMDYPRNFGSLGEHYPELKGATITAWNLGFVELVYLIPVNIVILWLAFRPSKRLAAGFITALTGVLYAPVRFFMDYLRPEDSDPRHLGLTFAQWSSILALGVAIYAAVRIRQSGKPEQPVTRTSGEAQRRLRTILKEDADKLAAEDGAGKSAKADAKADTKRDPSTRSDPSAAEDEALAKEALAAGAGSTDPEDAGEDDEDAEDAEDAAPADKPASAPGRSSPRPGGKKKRKKKR